MIPRSTITAYLPVLILQIVLLQLTGANYSPPRINENAFKIRNVYFKEEEDIELPCSAEGTPPPVYSWIKDGEEIDLESPENKGRMSFINDGGSLHVKPAKIEDEGIYQCRARNAHGISLSVKVNVRQARIEPFRTREPELLRPLLSHALKLVCVPPLSVPPAKISWIIDKGLDDEDQDSNDQGAFNSVNLDDRITMDFSGNLYITNVKFEDAQNGNKYVCMANNAQVRSFNQGEDKIVEPLGMQGSNLPVEMLWHSNTDVEGLVGRTVRFKCIFSGNPQPHITWIRVEKKAEADRMKQSADKFEFVIRKVQYSDAGEYECAGFNGIYEHPIKHRFRLNVEAKPRWTKKPTDIEAGVEEDVTFLCEGEGTPTPDVQWFINGKPLEQATEITRRTFRKGQLMFTDLQESDSQVIQCNVSNVHGFLWADVFLNVLAIPATVTKRPEPSMKVAEDKTVKITCQTEGKPTPTVTWFKGDQQLLGGRYNILPTGDLVINGVRLRDSGNYRCFVENRFGKDNANGTLVVRGKTLIATEPVNLQPIHGNDAMFKCDALTDPHEKHKLKYTWYLDNEPVIIDNDRVLQENGDLIIKNTNSKDTGNYTCIASNGLDEDKAWATMKVKAPPDPPYNVTVLTCLGREAQIRWEFDASQENFSPLQKFILEYNTSYAPEHWEMGAQPKANERQAKIILSPYANYTFRIKAVNRIGVGQASPHTSVICRTPIARPGHHPENVKTVGEKTNFLIVEWEPMEKIDLNAEGFFYNITVQKEGDDTVESYIIDDHTISRKEIPVDTVYERYIVTVQAKNQVGWPLREATPITGYSGQAAPLVVPQNFELDPEKNISSASAGFRWDPVDTSPKSMQGEFTGYKVRVWKKDQQDTTMKEIFIPHTPSRGKRRRKRRQVEKVRTEVRDLPSFSDLEADVVATNAYFSSNGSNVINFTTPEGVPTAVSYFTAVNVGSTHFTLAWGEPVEKNGIITGYDIGYQPINGIVYGDMKEMETLGADVHQTYLGGLEADTQYRIFIWGRTQQGKGSHYIIDVKTSEKSIPLAKPEILEALSRPNSVNVTWKLPDKEGQRVGADYYVEYKRFGLVGKWNVHKNDDAMNNWIVVDNLESGIAYEVRVVAQTGVPGDQDYAQMASEKRTFTTGGTGNWYPVMARVFLNGSITNNNSTTDGGAFKRSNILSSGWFIGMMVAIAILLLILIIVCIIKRNRGDKYHVQEKERLRGSNQEDPAENFNELGKSDTNGIGQSGSFDNNPEKMPLGDETDSMEEYGDVDPAKFNEDGSFIGEYGGQKGVGDQQASTMATLA
ncbi:neuroglian isoform X2 [Patella vulgata]|uniref:neuroglian isoform X2 n=1 Tax=Patella vulgata TaxID=6465 RepID=UPI0024A852EF|nr:neuroglian isoform X2 [Patella vulgata]